MAHQRARHLSQLVTKSLKFSPIVGVLGHRQVGKTTLTEALCTQYVTLDAAVSQAQANADPEAFLATHQGAPLAIDECQLAPPVFPALKEWVRTRKSPGQFLLTGSVRFTSRKAIRESLTGRIIAWELLPMDWSEQHSRPLPDTVIRLLEGKDLKVNLTLNPTFNVSNYRRYLETGGLPGVFAVRDPAIRTQRFETQLNTILERDLKLLLQTTLPYSALRALMVSLAKQVGTPLSIAQVARETKISLPTLRKLIPVLESLYLIRLIPSAGDFSKPVLFFEDLAEQQHLAGAEPDALGALLSFLYQNLRVQTHYRPELKVEIFNYLTRAGHRVPLCFRRGNQILGVVPLIEKASLAQAKRGAEYFIKAYPTAKVVIVTVADQDQLLAPRIRLIGAGRLV